MSASIASTRASILASRNAAQIEEMIAPFAAAARRLDEIPGINSVAACAILAEIDAFQPLVSLR